MFKQFWKDDYEFYSSQKVYAKGKSILYYIMIAFVIFFNYALMSTPVNAYMESGSAFTIENFTDYKSIEQCNYSLSATKQDGTIYDAKSQITMNCYTLNNSNPLANDYTYIKTSDKIFRAKYYDWVSADDLTFNQKYTYLGSLKGSNLLSPSKHPTQEGVTIYSPSETDYLKETGNTWDYYKILQFVPSWISENKYIYENSSNGDVYYSINSSTPGYVNDSYYKYDRDGNVVYNQYSELANLKVDYLYFDGNKYGYGDTAMDGSELSVGGYYDDFVILKNVNKALYKLQHYEHTYNNKDINGVPYGQEEFIPESYFKDGVYYLWDTSENLFYAYEINTLQELGFISAEEVSTQKNAGNTIINRDTEKNLISKVKKYREFFETTYTLESNVQEVTGTTTEVSKTPISTNNTYTEYEISKNPISYDTRYSYYWTYVTEYLYEYISQYRQMKYKYSIQPQVKTDVDQTTTTYSLSQTSQQTTTGDPLAGYSLCSTSMTVGPSTKCYTSSTTGTYSFSDKHTTTIYSKNTTGTVSNEVGDLNYTESKDVYIGGVSTKIYKTANGWVYLDGSATKYNEYLSTNTYNISVQSTGTTTYEYENSSLAMSKNLNSVTLSNGATFTIYGNPSTSDKFEDRYRNNYRYISSSRDEYYYAGSIPSSVSNNLKSNIATGLKSGNSVFYVDAGTTGNYLYDYKKVYNPYFIFVQIYNSHDGYTYWAAPTASYKSGYATPTVQGSGSATNCNKKDCALEQQNGLLKGDIWYKITSSEYSSGNFAFTSKTQQGIPWCSDEWGLDHYNVVKGSKVDYNTYYASYSQSYKSVNVKDGGTVSLKYGYSTYSRQSSVPTSGKADDGLTVSVNYGYYITYSTTSSYAQRKYIKYNVSIGSDSDSELTTSIKNNTYGGTYNTSGMKWYYGSYSTESIKTGTYYRYPYKIFKVSLSTLGNNTGWYRAAYGGTNYYYKNNTSGFDTRYNSSQQSTSTEYSSTSMNYNTTTAYIKTKSLSYNTSNGTIKYYKPIISTTKEVVISVGTSAPGVTSSGAAETLKSNYSNAIQSASGNGNGNTLTIVYVDGTTKTITGISYMKYTYYQSTSTVDTSTGDVIGNYSNNGNLSYTVFETKQYGTSNYQNIVPKTSTTTNSNTTFNTDLFGTKIPTSAKTTVTTIETTITTRDVYTYVGMEETSSIVKLYNENVSAFIPTTNNMGFKGNIDSLSGAFTNLTECSNSSTGVCYKHIDTILNRELDAKTMSITSTADYSQSDMSNYSLTENEDAFYKNHIPTSSEAHSNDYERRICASSTDTNCYRDNPNIEVKYTPRYSLKTITTTYSIKAIESTNPIYYNSQTSNSTLNDYMEFGTLNGAKYYNDGSLVGGSYTKTEDIGGINSLNKFNEKSWFINADFIGLVKKGTNNEYNLSGKGTATYTIIGLNAGEKYTLSFMAKSTSDNSFKVIIDGKTTDIDISAVYSGLRNSVTFIADDDKVNITFDIDSNLIIKEIALKDNTDISYTQYATYTMGNVSNVFYQSYKMNETYSYYDVKDGEETGGFALTSESKIIGYTNEVKDANGWETGLIKLNEQSGINANYVVMGNDFNNDGVIASNEKYAIAKDSLVSICLDGTACRYRYLLTGKSDDFKYVKTRTLSVKYSSYPEYLDKTSVLDIDTVNSSSLEGSNSNVNSNLINSIDEKTKHVMVNGSWYSIDSKYGKYSLFMEYLNDYNQDKSIYKYDDVNDIIYLRNTPIDYYKYEILHDENKLYNSVTDSYDKLDKGYTLETLYESKTELQTIISDLILSKDYLNEKSVVKSYVDTVPKLTQEKLYALYEANNNSVSYNCKDKNLGITLENCTFTYKSNNGIEPITLDDLLDDNLESNNSYFGVIISSEAFSGKNPYYRYDNLDYKFELDETKVGYIEYQRYLFGGYWQEKDILADRTFNHYYDDYAEIDAIHNKVDSYLKFYQINENNNRNIYVNDMSLYIFNNPSKKDEKDFYESNVDDKYFYAWITGDVKKTPYKNYDIVQVIGATELYSYITKASSDNEDSVGTRYILINDGNKTLRIALKEMFVTQGEAKYLYQLKGKADSRDMRINNIISLADLEVLDMGKGIDSDKLAGVNDVTSESVSYALKFSGMLNYWNTTINGDNFITQDADAKTCTLDIQKVHQKDSTISFETENGLETVTEFLLQNRGKQGNNYKGQNTYDLYALTKVLDDGQYYDVTLGGSSGNNLITTFVEALNILQRNGYTGYMFKDGTNAEKSEALKELSKLDENAVFDWESLAFNPEYAEKWFGNSAYANLIYYQYAKGENGTDTNSSNGVHFYNAQEDFLYGENTSGKHYGFYKDVLKVLYSYLLFGVLIPDYQNGASYPHISHLKSESLVEKSIIEMPSFFHKESESYHNFVEEIQQTYQTLINNSSGSFDNKIDNETRKNWYNNLTIIFPQVIGIIVDSYSIFNDYNVTILPKLNNYDTLYDKTNANIILNMIPTLMYSSNMEDNINIIKDSFGSNLLEMNITNILDYVSQINSTDYVFVKSNKVSGRYYIYKLLEASDKSGSYDGTVPSATIIRQNTLVDENGLSKYNDGNSLVALNDNNLSFMTVTQNAWKYSNDTITTGGWDKFGKWWENVFTGTGLTGDTNEGNVLYALIKNSAYEKILNLTTINNLSSYIWTTEAYITKYQPLSTFTSFSQSNPTYYYSYVAVNESDIDSDAIIVATDKSFIKDMLKTGLKEMAENPSKDITEDLGEQNQLNKWGYNIHFTQKNSNGEKLVSKYISSINLKVVKFGQKISETTNEICSKDYCITMGLPYSYELDEISFSGKYTEEEQCFDGGYCSNVATAMYVEYNISIISDYQPDSFFVNGHSLKNTNSNFDENLINENMLSVNYIENNIAIDTDYSIGKTNFSISVSDVIVLDETNKIFAHNSDAFEYSLTYVPKEEKKCNGDNFEYNDFTGLCHFKTKDKNQLTLNNWSYKYTIPIKATYEDVLYDEESGSTETEIYTIEKEIQLFLSSRNISVNKLTDLAAAKFYSLYSGQYYNLYITSMNLNKEVKTGLNIFNTASDEITFDNLPADTTFMLSIQKRMHSGYTTKVWSKEFTTGIDMVMNPYGKALSAKPTLTLTSEQIENGLLNGDNLLKEEYIPYDLQKCIFSYDTSKDPSSEGVSICGKYVISNKYRLQLSAAETIKIGFAIVDEKGNNVFAKYGGAIGEKVGFVVDIDAPIKKYHVFGTNNQNYSLISSNRESKNDLGIFYYNFNQTDFEEYKKYSSPLDFVNNYILQKYTIELTKKTYDYMNRYFRNQEFKVKIIEYYDDRFTYLDYNQNGKFDENALSASFKYYDKNGISTFYEKTNVEHYRDNCLAMSTEMMDNWLSASLFVNGNEYPTFKPGQYRDKAHVSHYYIFGYDPNNQAQIVK